MRRSASELQAIEAMINRFRDDRESIEDWMERIRLELEQQLGQPDSRIHSIRYRIKDIDHLRRKLTKKWPKYRRKLGRQPNEADLYDLVQDLLGFRILVLYQNDIAVLDRFIRSNKGWEVCGTPEGNFDKNRLRDRKFFVKLGMKPKPRENGYITAHYILKDRDSTVPCKICELQVRTVHQESWAEFSHQFEYPERYLDQLGSALVKRASDLLQLYGDIVDDIRRYPIQAQIYKLCWEKAQRQKASVNMESCLKAIAGYIENSPYLYRYASYAAFGLLMGSHLSGEIKHIVTIDFAPKKWTKSDQWRDLYYQAQEWWLSQNSKRKITKFFVANDGAFKSAARGNLLLQKSGVQIKKIQPIDFKRTHELISNAIGQAKPWARDFLPGLQFFAWIEGKPVPFPPNKERKVFSFYSLFEESDLLVGVLWNHNRHGDATQLIKRYVDTLLFLAEEGLAIDPDQEHSIQFESISKKISAYVDHVFSKRELARTSG
jgi:ppGpp synthetase/RelA/SpoT-type nucleotidyltranferase